jgi:ribosomal protein L11 methyltransferase
MSFGTGHHETTHMMIQHLLETDVTGMKTLDMGCGTAILAILAEMKGAQPIDAIDMRQLVLFKLNRKRRTQQL